MFQATVENVVKLGRKVFGSANERKLAELVPTVDEVCRLEPEFQRKTDAELRELTDRFRERLRGPKSFEEKQRTLNEILPHAFANMREAARRTMVTPAADSPYPMMRPFDVQVLGGLVLHNQMIAEMVTGEGKTLVAIFAAYLNSLAGDGVHIVTVNDYLAARDCQWMGPAYNLLGTTAGAIQSHQEIEEKAAAYRCDVTYGTSSEFGFDYLRDNMKYDPETQVQLSRGLHYAIVDEVDNILIDEARMPLILSGPVDQQSEKFHAADRIVRSLKKDADYEVKEKEQSCRLTDPGEERVEQMLGVDSLRSEGTMEWPHFIETALRAHELYQRDTEYMIKDGEVVIVDEFTGRPMEGRVWSDGLHQAVTVKEGLKLREETQTIATITYQNFFRLYDKLAGMTGTAMTEASEFDKIYRLGVLALPTNLPLIRMSHPDVVYRTEDEKWKATVDEICQVHEEKRPVLVGTTSIEKSEKLGEMLSRKGIAHQILNARPEHAAREADVITEAGKPGVVTIATNMAGRGTDIVLGEGIADKGGLHIVGTERHEARRIDNQLRGRAGRQGDPGSSRFFVSFEDDLMRIFAPDSVRTWLRRAGMDEGVALESKMVTRCIEKAQKRVEEYNFDIRKNLLEYDEVMDEQRKSVYSWRQKLVERKDVEEEIISIAEDAVRDGADLYLEPRRSPDQWDLDGLNKWFAHKFSQPARMPQECLGDADAVEEHLLRRAREVFQDRCERFGAEAMLDFGRYLMLRTIDMKWKDHLHAMDELKSGIGLRGYAQLDPKIEYKSEASQKFEQMLIRIDDEFTDLLFGVEVEERGGREVRGIWQVSEARHDEFSADHPLPEEPEVYAPGAGAAAVEPIIVGEKVSRNAPCPCGSGKKYKHCCGRT